MTAGLEPNADIPGTADRSSLPAGTAWASDAKTRREALATARRSRRPSRLGQQAGSVARPDYVVAADAGFPDLLDRAWQRAREALDVAAALDILLTLGGYVPSDISLRTFTIEEECALQVLFGLSWRPDTLETTRPDGTGPAFVGEVGLTSSGRVVVRVPSHGPLDGTHELVGGVLRLPWSDSDVTQYRVALNEANARAASAVADCRGWLSALTPAGLSDVLTELTEATRRTAPVIFYCRDRQYTNFRDRNTVTGKTLWPGHPDCAFSSLAQLGVDLWADEDVCMVACLIILIRAGGYTRIEEVNGTQLTLDHVFDVLERSRVAYNRVLSTTTIDSPIAPGSSPTAARLDALARAIADQRPNVLERSQLYRQIHGPLMHKVERVAGRPSAPAKRREADTCARLRESLPVTGSTLAEMRDELSASPQWLALPHNQFGSGLESLIYETVRASTAVFHADFAMSRGMRSLTALVDRLRAKDWMTIAAWDLPQFFCCVVPSPDAHQMFDGSRAHLADTAWAISARMQYNSWHFLVGNLSPGPAITQRDYFTPPGIPDIAYYSDQHHHGHVAAKVRFTVRSPQPVRVLGIDFRGFVDLRLLRCEGTPFTEQDLLAAQRTSKLIATATQLAAELVSDQTADGQRQEMVVNAFDPRWHRDTIIGAASTS